MEDFDRLENDLKSLLAHIARVKKLQKEHALSLASSRAKEELKLAGRSLKYRLVKLETL